MSSTSRLLGRVQRQRVTSLGKPAATDQEAVCASDTVTREAILADEQLRTQLAQERAARSYLRWRRWVRWILLVGFVVLFVATISALAVAWSREQTGAAVAAASAIAVQVTVAAFAAIRQEMFGPAQNETAELTSLEDEEEHPSAQLSLVLPDQ